MRLVVLGLDGANFSILNPLIQRGVMPNLKDMIKNGCYGKLESVVPPVTAPAWASFSTGKNPVKHGAFFFTLPRERLDDFRPVTSQDMEGETFYESLEKPVIINLPSTYPPRIEGTMITSLLTQGEDFVFPSTLREEISELKNYRIIPDESLHVKNQIDDYIRDIRELEKTRFEVAKKIFKEKDWNFFFLMFSGSDWVQHWRFKEIIEGSNKEADNLFRDLDKYIGWFLGNLPKDCNIFLVSDHGFKNYKRKFYINKWLEHEGYLSVVQGHEQAVDESMKERVVSDYLKKNIKVNIGNVARISSKMPFVYKVLKKAYVSLVKLFPFLKGDVGIKFDVEKSKARAVWGGVYINDKRFNGILGDKQDVVEEIIRKLKVLEDPVTKKKVMEAVWKKEDLCKDSSDKVPDIIFDIRDHELSYFLLSHSIFDNVSDAHHSSEGIFLAYGEDIRRGKIENASLVDLAPTILHYYGKKIPRDVDGKVLNLYNVKSRLSRLKIRYKDKDLSKEKKLIKNIVKNLKV